MSTYEYLDINGASRLANHLKLYSRSATLSSASWTASSGVYTQTVSVTGLSASEVCIVSLGSMTNANRKMALKCLITPISQASGSITFEASILPTADVPIVITTQGVPLQS